MPDTIEMQEVSNPEENEKDPRQLKKERQEAEDRAYQENEIKYGIRYKLISVVSVLVLLVVIVITIIASNNQTKALMSEKEKQGKIIVRALASSIKTQLIQPFADNDRRIKRLSSAKEYTRFYEDLEINELIFENLDQVKTQPDVIYAYILGKHKVVLGHTRPQVNPYKVFSFDDTVQSYFDLYKVRGMETPLPILEEITFQKEIPGPAVEEGKESAPQTEEIEAVDFSFILSFKDNPTIEDAIGEIHIGISLEAVNEQIASNKRQMQAVGFFAVLAGILSAIVVAAVIARPIRQMIAGMRKVSEGDFNASVLVSSGDEVGLLSKTFNVMLKGLGLLVSPEVAQVVLSGGDLMKSGQKKNVTVLFSDIRGFTTISESLTPQEVVEMLNDYLDVMTEIIIKYGGVVDKFVGDEIFAVFGAPFEHPLHPLCAAATALEMGVDLKEHNEERKTEGKLPIKIGIGVNTGDVIAGAMGSKKRIDFTSIGDAVNLGARLEGTNKVYGTLAIMSEFTYAYVKNDVIVRELDLIKVKGKNEPVMIYEVISLTQEGERKLDQYLTTKGVSRHI